MPSGYDPPGQHHTMFNRLNRGAVSAKKPHSVALFDEALALRDKNKYEEAIRLLLRIKPFNHNIFSLLSISNHGILPQGKLKELFYGRS